ncbi:MAG: response regulator [Leptolyngbyaceae cyanobacterium SM2_3_12]|nr:response regulator [Leptolyngbyaceae cyanobacterium SM2_3_12]
MVSTSSPPPLHPLSLLAQISSRQVTGCLKVTTPAMTWLLFLDQGRLNYVSTVERAFERLDAHLRQLSLQVPTLVSAVRVQVRLLFERQISAVNQTSDYQAICWLVEQQYLHPSQASALIEALTKEALEAFLEVRQGSYELSEADSLKDAPIYCQLNLRTTVEECYNRMKQGRHGAGHTNGLQSPQRKTAPPLTQTAMTLPKPMAGSGAINGSAPTLGRTKTQYTIACIDDSPTVLRAINEFLDDKIFSVIMIDDPVKALMQVIRNKPDLILLDVTMPSLDGYELCSLLRRHPDFKDVPIIMVTSNTGFIDRAKAKLVRASGYLTKPFGQSDLLKIIFKYLN